MTLFRVRLPPIAPANWRDCAGLQALVIWDERPAPVQLALCGRTDLLIPSAMSEASADLGGGLCRLSQHLAPRGRMLFSTLGCDTFSEWRQVHTEQGLSCGAHHYPSANDFPWPDGFSHQLHAEWVAQFHASGLDFVRSLKAIGDREPTSGYQPLAPGALRRLLASLGGGFSVTYHILYGEIVR